ncbi:MAG TPA: amidohydrolase, partial [Novosphingobium sp.]|nr:amidohydrolase [Novosphingobium sp.]
MIAPRRFASALAALLAATAAPALAQDMAITNARLVIGDGSAPIEGGTVVVRGGKVIAAGAGVSVPAGVPVTDAGGKWVTPGLVVAVTDLGLIDVGAVDESNDEEAKKARFSAALDIAPAINPLAQPIAVSRAGGVTRAAVAPLSTASIFEGQGAVIDLGADPNAVTTARAFQYVELGEGGAELS